MKKASIIGFGRFGKILYRLLKNDFLLTLYDTNKSVFEKFKLEKNTIIAKDLKKVYESDVIFYSVPISVFEKVICEQKKYFQPSHLLIDVLSVKMHPAKVLGKALKNTKTQALLTHPMFGPDSSKDSFTGLPIIIDKFKFSKKNYDFWKKYFEQKKLTVIEMSARKHDKIAANTQGITHFIGRLLEELDFKDTKISSVGAKRLLQVKEQTCNDSRQLFRDLQQYNQFTKKMRSNLGKAYDKIYNQLLPQKINPELITFGIQGGEGSFNEEAIMDYVSKNKIKNYHIKYLYTSEKVLKNLHEGNTDYGLFAIQNATGGLIDETIHAMAKYKFKIVEELKILVKHYLMKRKDVHLEKIKTIMAHPQNFAQCKKTLSEKHPRLEKLSGEGDLVDTARVAFYLSKNKLPQNTAILGPKTLSKKFDLEIIDENLQDQKDNLTSFLLVSR